MIGFSMTVHGRRSQFAKYIKESLGGFTPGLPFYIYAKSVDGLFWGKSGTIHDVLPKTSY